ncbi:MAG: xanthine dehydrogenase family protein molybdopterin-binding subunit [Vulcanimicrobiota bacterium]
MPAVGKNLIRVDSREKVTGEAKYIEDINYTNQLHSKIVFSTVPHGKIKSIDFAEALKVDGVVDVITVKDVPGKNHVHIIMDDYPIYAEDKVKFTGQIVAMVVAETAAAAEAGRDLVEVEYEPLDYSLEILESIKKDAVKIYGDDNIFKKYQVLKGDTDSAFKNADIIVENEYRTGYQEHAYIETQGVLALPGHDGSMTIYGSMQCPFYVHDAVTDTLGIPSSKVRIVQTVTGGGFGGKEDVPSLIASAAAVAAHKTKRPCKLILTREEDIMAMSKRHPSLTRYKTAADKDGNLLAIDVTYYLDAGAYSTLSPVVLWRGAVHALGPYRCPNIKVHAYAVATNKVPCGAYRGFGTPQILFAHESQMDALADRLKMDPYELRSRNALKFNEETITGQKLNQSFGLDKVMEQAHEKSGWDKKRREFGFDKGAGDIRKGIGMSTIFYGVGLGAGGKYIARAGAYVEVYKDGSLSLAVGTTEMGQGMRTVLSQIASEEMGVPLEKVHMLETDTTRVPDSGPTVASRSTVMSGNAILEACRQLKTRMAPVAARILQAKHQEIVFRDGKVFVEDYPDWAITFDRLAEQCVAEKIHLGQQGWFEAPYTSFDEANGQGWAYFTYAYACNVAEVSVDIKTGAVTVDRLTAAHDVGKAINPVLVEGQIEGGSMQGMGYGVVEDIIHDEKGNIINPNFSTYIIPTVKDVPEIESVIVEEHFPRGPFGAKGFGEQPLMGIAPAVVNAIAHATGTRPDRIPAIPERIVHWIQEKQ